VLDDAKIAPEERFPPSVVDSDVIVAPFGEPVSMSRIITVDRTTPAFDDISDELAFPVLVRDANANEELQYKLFVDRQAGTSNGLVDQNVIAGMGQVERELPIRVSVAQLGMPGCHRIELFVAGEFEFNTSVKPLILGDIDSGVWWVRVLDLAVRDVDLGSCPQ
jgi:hypothetical protein